MDFSQINLQYLIHAQDLARQDPRRAGVLLELPEDQVDMLCSLTPDQLARFALIRSPLLIPRGERWWWSRLLAAASDGCQVEFDAILEHDQFRL